MEYHINDLKNIQLNLKKTCIIFLYGDLGSWKTTLSKHILQNQLWIDQDITSPTYTYYHKYNTNYHFDLYRLKDYDEFFAIGWEDVLDNLSGVALIEWPELLEPYYQPDIVIHLEKTNNLETRKINISYANR